MFRQNGVTSHVFRKVGVTPNAGLLRGEFSTVTIPLHFLPNPCSWGHSPLLTKYSDPLVKNQY